MNSKRPDELRLWLAAAVFGHLIISLIHGYAHAGAHVDLTAMQSAFVYMVILAGPLIGFALFFLRPRAGALLIAAAMAGSLVFGLVNHFIVASPDHVAHVVEQWRPLFTGTAVLLVATESLGVFLGLRSAS